ncbi:MULTISPECIES: hypothetical protein [Clostridium]|uniref:Lipoprotein n=1 Tax=Clostridium aquiflavi TaxID=3073603 RepID=A0ABU1EDL6_9CLOT|nr:MULTISPECIES: hypothetical protein [unclassified Clostridium]MDR5586458.1 hypothetical protein [Clostridium sp. 5N-1]NFG62102.1 hypothetical protein [Clostridium botulinum]NFQ10189.1 hypothetical protein [Clostridium botulinum]
MKKIILIIMSMMMIFISIGCSNQTSNNEKIDLYDSKKAIETAQKYLMEIQNENFEEAKKFCTKDFASASKINDLGNSKIQVFKTNKSVDGGDKMSIIFDVLRGEDYSPNNNLDKYNIDVIKENDEYKINNLSASEESEVYERESELRLQTSGAGESKLILKLSDIPKQVYNKGDNPLERVDIPSDKFSSCGLSYSSNKVAYSTTNGKDSFIGILYIKDDKSVTTIGSNQDDTKNKSDNKSNAIEKVQTDKVMNFGILNDCQIERIVFSAAEDNLVVSYKNSNEGTGLKIFNVESGKESSLDIKSKFPTDKYNVRVMFVNEEEITVRVTLLEGVSEKKEDLTGMYVININKSTIDKK